MSSVIYRVRTADSADAKEIAALGRMTFDLAYGAIVRPEDMERYLDRMFDSVVIASEIDQIHATYFIAECVDGVIGYAKLGSASTEPVLLPKGNHVELVRLYVDVKHCGAGVGEKLLKAARDHALEGSFNGWWLRVWQKNDRAIRFYEGHGFETIGSEPYLIGETANPVAIMYEGLASS